MTNSKDSKWTPEHRKEYMKEWQEKNKDKVKETQKKYREKKRKEKSIENSGVWVQRRKKEDDMKNPIKRDEKRVSDPKGREEIPLELVQDFAERFKGNILENKS